MGKRQRPNYQEYTNLQLVNESINDDSLEIDTGQGQEDGY